jgi:putative ABC transport system permease protein
MRNVIYALRTLRYNPGFAIVAVLTLALAVGANTAMFSVVDGVLLRQLPYRNAGRIVAVNTSWPQKGKTIPRVTGPDIMDIRDSAQAFENLSFYYGGEVGVQLANHAEFTGTVWVTPEFFAVFGDSPVFGRLFQPDDGKRAAIVALPFATRNFGSGAAALGQVVHIEGVAYDIVGVMPASFHFPEQSQVWVDVSDTAEARWSHRTAFNYHAVAALKPGVSLETANTQLSTIGSRLEAEYPDANKGKTFLAVRLRDQLVGSASTTVYFLMGAVGLLLLIACANIANLMLARATARSREMAVRAALGATRSAIIRQLLVESGVLALIGGGLGLLIAFAGTMLLARAGAQQVGLPRVSDIHVNWIVFLFAMGISLAASFLFGISPALHASKVDFNDALKAGGRGVAGGSNRLRNGLVVAQIALSFVLAIGAGLLFRSFLALTSVNLGFRTDGMLVMYAHDPARTLDDYLAAGRFFQNVVAEMRALPGVKSAAAVMGIPTGEYGSNGNYVIDGHNWEPARFAAAHADFTLTSPGYFSTMGIPLLRGRDFNAGDNYDGQFVTIISESVARQSFPGQDPIGHTIQSGLDAPPKWMTVVGVVADVRQDSPAAAPGPNLYMPLLQHPYFGNEVQVAMRTAVSPTSIIDTVRSKMLALNPEVPTKFTTMEAMVSDTIATPRLRMMLVGAFAALALLLAVIGMYGVMSYVTTQRIPEFGVRMALGATPRNVVLLVLRRATMLALAGVAIGVTLAAASARVISSMLYGLKASDVTTYAAVLTAVTIFVVLAAAIPAWRASRIDPLAALRQE